MQCVPVAPSAIAGENPGDLFSCEIYKWYKSGLDWSQRFHLTFTFKARVSKVDMEKQEGSSDVENPPSVENLSITEEEDLTNMEDVIIIKSAGQQNDDIQNRNKHLKTIALNILKYLLKTYFVRSLIFQR